MVMNLEITFKHSKTMAQSKSMPCKQKEKMLRIAWEKLEI